MKQTFLRRSISTYDILTIINLCLNARIPPTKCEVTYSAVTELHARTECIQSDTVVFIKAHLPNGE
jgi:hypothetical protein